MHIIVYGPFGSGKTTLTNTLRYVLKKHYNIDVAIVQDRDDDPNSRNDPFLEKAQTDSPDGYEKHCDQAYISSLNRYPGLEAYPIFHNGDWARRIDRIKTELAEIFRGNPEKKVPPREIKALFCHCTFPVQRRRMKDRNAPRDLAYIKDEGRHFSESSLREPQYKTTMQTLRSIGIQVTEVNTEEIFATENIQLGTQTVTILSYDKDPKIKAYVDWIIKELRLNESPTQAAGVDSPDKTPLQTTLVHKPQLGQGRMRSGSDIVDLQALLDKPSGVVDETKAGLTDLSTSGSVLPRKPRVIVRSHSLPAMRDLKSPSEQFFISPSDAIMLARTGKSQLVDMSKHTFSSPTIEPQEPIQMPDIELSPAHELLKPVPNPNFRYNLRARKKPTEVDKSRRATKRKSSSSKSSGSETSSGSPASGPVQMVKSRRISSDEEDGSDLTADLSGSTFFSYSQQRQGGFFSRLGRENPSPRSCGQEAQGDTDELDLKPERTSTNTFRC